MLSFNSFGSSCTFMPEALLTAAFQECFLDTFSPLSGSIFASSSIFALSNSCCLDNFLLFLLFSSLPELLIGDGAIIANHRVGVIHLRLIFAVILILILVADVFLLASVCGDLLGLDALLEEVKGSSGRLGRVQAGATRLPEVDAGLSLGVLGQALEPARVYPHRREGKIGPGSAAPRGGRRRGSGRG
ncbi:unnamed protein product [Musa banksii]